MSNALLVPGFYSPKARKSGVLNPKHQYFPELDLACLQFLILCRSSPSTPCPFHGRMRSKMRNTASPIPSPTGLRSLKTPRYLSPTSRCEDDQNPPHHQAHSNTLGAYTPRLQYTSPIVCEDHRTQHNALRFQPVT